VHLTTQSLPVRVVRASFGPELLIGVSTHSIEEAETAKEGGADFIVFGPVFQTLSKPTYGNAVGIEALAKAISQVAPLPVLALGGVDLDKVGKCANVGAAGVAAITMFDEPDRLVDIAREVRARYKG
jgi:thiamine-phosphate pyrophosphorylase